MQSTRNLKVERRYRSLKYGVTKPISQIKLIGNWLEQAGFLAGDEVEVSVADGCLTLRPVVAG